VIRVDMERRQIDLGLVEILEAVRETMRPHTSRGRVHARQERRQRPGRRERAQRRAAKGRKGRKR
jgi:hypothetical protein